MATPAQPRIPDLFTLVEVAARLHLDRRTVGKLFRGNPGVVIIPGPMRKRNRVLIPASLLEDWYERRGGRPEIQEADRTVE